MQEEFSMGDGFIMLLAAILLLTAIGFYFEAVMPKTFGKRQHPCFCCLSKPKRKPAPAQNSVSNSDSPDPMGHVKEIESFETQFLNKECYEPVTSDMATLDKKVKTLKIQNLKKTYENGFRAVDGINLKLFQDQIFVLLGHNGAGKTTTISMLTGLYGATQGNAEVYGVDIFNDLEKVREFMGVCPQHDVLFTLLTPEEHLDLFFDFKGGKAENKKTEIEKLLKDIGLDDKRTSYAYQLSGGNKRKLSVAISLCGGSKFVMLDEPTSGLDLSARRQLWNMLREYKKDRILILTTHYMDEADVLGDRIGIMTAGRLTCLGTSLFLKNKFSVGYNLKLIKENAHENPEIIDFCRQQLGPKVTVASEIQLEISINVPMEYNEMFGAFFTALDQNLKALKIKSYGVSITTLDDVFMRIGHLSDPISSLKNGRASQINENSVNLMENESFQRMHSLPDRQS